MSAQELIATAKAMVAEDKGLLAMDESTPKGEGGILIHQHGLCSNRRRMIHS